jgi:hypothetical protein
MILVAGALLFGLALTAAAFPRAVSRAEQIFRIAAGALLGLGATGAASMALRLCKVPAESWKSAVLAATGAAVLVAVRGGGLHLAPDVPRPPPERALAAATALAAVLVSALFVEHTVRYPDGGWDARAIWNLRARSLHRAPLRLDLAFSPEMPEAHPDYPLLVPALVADALAVADGPASYASAAVALAFTVLFVAVTATGAAALAGNGAGHVAALAEKGAGPVAALSGKGGGLISAVAGNGAGLVSALAILGFPALLAVGWSQTADVPLAGILAAACALCARSHASAFGSGPPAGGPVGLLARGGGGALALAGFAASLCALTKNEGLVWAVALSAAVFWTMGSRAALAMLSGAAPGLLLLLVFKLRFVPPNDLAQATTLLGLAARIADPHRAAAVASGLVSQMWNFADWGLTGPALVLFLAWPSRQSLSVGDARAARVLRRTLGLSVLSLFAIYLAAPRDVNALMSASVQRLLLQLSGPAVLLASFRWTVASRR